MDAGEHAVTGAARVLAWPAPAAPWAAVLRPDSLAQEPRLGEGVAAYLATLDHPESAATCRVYGYTLRALADRFGADTAVAALDGPAGGAALAGWFERAWGQRAPATSNRNLDALRAAVRYWRGQGWLRTDPTTGLRRRARPPDRTRALSRAEIEALLSRQDIGLRERVLWRLLYETAARASEALALDIDELTCPTGARR